MDRIKRLAIELRCRPHALFIQGVDLMLKKHGQAPTKKG